MIEIQIDQQRLDKELARLQGSAYRLSRAVKIALYEVTPQVRAEVIGVLEKNITVGSKFVRRAVKAVRHMGDSAQFRVFSKSLFLDDYELTPREQTARAGTRSKDWPGFTYKLRNDGKTFHSFGTPTGRDGTGSTPFIAKAASGNLRVMYRRNPNHVQSGEDNVFLAYAPPVQYHAVAPEVEELARATSMRLFHDALRRAIDELLAGRAS